MLRPISSATANAPSKGGSTFHFSCSFQKTISVQWQH